MSFNMAKTALRKLKTALHLPLEGIHGVYIGRCTPWEVLLIYVDRTIRNLTKKSPHFYSRSRLKRLKREYLRDGMWVFKEVRFPPLDRECELMLPNVLDDTLLVYLEYGDCYDEAKIKALCEYLPEGPYGLRNDRVDVTIDAIAGGGGYCSGRRKLGRGLRRLRLGQGRYGLRVRAY
jgi:hypothetical protein